MRNWNGSTDRVLKGETLWSILTEHPIGVLLLIIVLDTFYDGIFRRRS
jgi:hypothetical protein